MKFFKIWALWDWWRMEWPFSRFCIFFVGRQKLQENPEFPQGAIFTKFQTPNFETSEPPKKQVHTPRRFHTPTRPPPKYRVIRKCWEEKVGVQKNRPGLPLPEFCATFGVLHEVSILYHFRNILRLSTAGNSMTSSERPSLEPLLKKKGLPSCIEGRRILEEKLRERFRDLSGFSSGHYSHDWSVYVNAIGVISELFAVKGSKRKVNIR